MDKYCEESLQDFEKQLIKEYEELTKASELEKIQELNAIDLSVTKSWAIDLRKNIDGTIERILNFEEAETKTAQQIIAPYDERSQKLDAEILDLKAELERVSLTSFFIFYFSFFIFHFSFFIFHFSFFWVFWLDRISQKKIKIK